MQAVLYFLKIYSKRYITYTSRVNGKQNISKEQKGK